MRSVNIARAIVEKIARRDHGSVSVAEVIECFRNTKLAYVHDRPSRHASMDGPTQWFVGTSDAGRKLKIVFVIRDEQAFVKTAHPASGAVQRAYAQACREAGAGRD